MKGASGWVNFQEYNKPIKIFEGEEMMTFKSVYADDFYRKQWEKLLENESLEPVKKHVYKWEDQGFLKVEKKQKEVKKVKKSKKKNTMKEKKGKSKIKKKVKNTKKRK